jgi:hypothetical protein
MKLNIYLVSQSENTHYDAYDSFVCYAENEEQARNMPPDYDGIDGYTNNITGKFERYAYPAKLEIDWSEIQYHWASDPGQVKVQLLGTGEAEKPVVICSSFNAG